MEESNRVDVLSLSTQSILSFYSPHFIYNCFLVSLVMIIHFYRIISKYYNHRNHKSSEERTRESTTLSKANRIFEPVL